MTVISSRYNVIVPLRRGRALAYNSFSGASAVLEPRERSKLRRLEAGERVRRDRVLTTLLYGGFAVEDGVDEVRFVEEEYRRSRFDASGMVLTIAPTLACNFGCDYCFQGTDKPCGKMSVEVQDATVALVERCTRALRRLHIAWYGGEPLLGLPVIEALSQRFIAICERDSVQYDAMIVTNGYRLTADVAQSLWALGVQVAQVTLDGAEDYHDQRRTLLGGQGTFERIIRNVKSVVDSVPVRIVVRINIDSRNSEGVPALLEHLHGAGLAHRRNFSVYFAPVEAMTEGCHVVASQCMSKSGYAQLETELQHRAYELGLATLPYPRRFLGLCGATRPRGFVVVPSGDLHKCWDTVSLRRMRIGTVFDPDAAVVSTRAREWANWTPFDNASCRSCKLLPSCAGSCAHKFVNPDQTLGEAGALPCPSWKYQLNERIVALAVRRGTISDTDYDPRAITTEPSEICSIAAPEQLLRSASRRQLRVIAAA
jgi:uncharacterized protein